MTLLARVLPMLITWALSLCAGQAAAEPRSVLALVSERSAPTLVEGAHRVLDREPDSSISIRTLTQLEQLSNAELQSLLASHDSLLLVAVFGDAADRLLTLSYPQNQRRYVIHSDRRLLALQRDRQGAVFANGLPEAVIGDREAVLDSERLAAKQRAFPGYRDWLQTRAYWVNGSVANAASLLRFVREDGSAPSLEVVAPLRAVLHRETGADWLPPESLAEHLDTARPVVWLLDHDSADLFGEWALHRHYCAAVQAQCVSLLAGWGKPSVAAIRLIRSLQTRIVAQVIVSLQDFVVGGGEGRSQVDELLADIDVPLLKGLRLADLSANDYVFSNQGIPRDSVHYRVAMPELQGISQSAILALASSSSRDARTGARVSRSEPMIDAIADHARRAENWLRLQRKANSDKRVAIVYYNHPPGRHNIGADNLNVPESLLEMLRALQSQGYDTGPLPKDADDLLDRLQTDGVNLPNDRAALASMSKRVASLSAEDYRKWFASLPEAVQAEMTAGPLARLAVRLRRGVNDSLRQEPVGERQRRLGMLKEVLHNVSTDIHHVLDGLRHPGRPRALALLEQMESAYDAVLASAAAHAQVPESQWQEAETLVNALVALDIEGLRGWGEIPGKVMVWQDRLLIPGVQFGKVFIGPQPPRGWEIHEELLHANLSFPPPHQYLAFYHYLRDVFKADAMVHVGRHSTYEFLPRRSVGLASDDYPFLVAGDVPAIYPYIVDGVGEGIQAKRRGQAVMVDHLTPPLAATELYDDLLELRQLIESAEAASDSSTRSRAVATLRQRIEEMDLREELIASMDEELTVRGVGFDEVDEEFLLHEVGHYLTSLQEAFMPLGLHVFGRDWPEESLVTMLTSMSDDNSSKEQLAMWRENLARSPAAEMQALLAGLSGRFVKPGKGNDPIRTPEALPTGRNFYALDGSLLPTRVGYAQGRELANAVLQGESLDIEALVPGESNKQGVILWASDAVRDEGAMIAFGMKLLGVRPVWNSRGIIKGLERIPLHEEQARRLDVVFTTSGLFRDLYGDHLVLLDKASLLALDASADLIREQYPLLIPSLDSALASLGEAREGGREPFAHNLVAANWVDEARALLKTLDGDATKSGRQASLRVFGIAPGSYGAGVNRLVERSGAWRDRGELADVFIKRMGHAYGAGLEGEAVDSLFRTQLAGMSNTYLGRASNLYGLIDNNDAFDYLGGLNMAVERVRGTRPESAVINHANADRARIDTLETALLGELRGRFLNPQWIKPLMAEGYAGARTMGSEFIEYLWGWQVTSPDIIRDEVWEAVKAVYVDDSHQLGLDDFLSEGHRRHVQTNMLAIMLVATDKGFWEASEATRQQLARQFADNVIEAGLPGSGHTHPDHPLFKGLKALLEPDQATALDAVLQRARIPEGGERGGELVRVAELQEASSQGSEAAGESALPDSLLWLLAMLAAVLMTAGYWRGRRAL